MTHAAGVCDLCVNVSSLCVSQSTAKERAKHAGDYFTLLRHLLNYAYNSNINLPNAEVLLNNEIDWLKRIRVGGAYAPLYPPDLVEVLSLVIKLYQPNPP